MRWHRMTLIIGKPIGTDELNNTIYEDVDGDTYKVRNTPWTEEEKSLIGRDVTANEQRYIVKKPFVLPDNCNRVRIDDRVVEIVKTETAQRWVILQVKSYGKD